MSSSPPADISFAELDLPQNLLKTLSKVGYEKPSPIQEATIPLLMQGRDLIGMAQTGTGKTAAFALPILSAIDVSRKNTQALVLCPTRELAIQVAEAFQTYAEGMRGFHVLPVYGGQDMGRQLTALRRGAHVVVGTPGRLLDHLGRGTMDLSGLKTLVLDEADEMLRMGFIDDVEMILQKTPSSRQVALFSATMPKPIRAVADKYLNKPEEVRIKSAASTNEDIEQFYWLVQGTSKLDALTRILEVEEFDGMIVFVRTKNSTVELADKLSARGFSAAPLNGDMNQSLRQRTVEQLKNGQLDILVATDVAARGLDVDRLSHVMNFDIPYDDEAYVHRIGRTGRAGRSGKAILFVAPREQRLLKSIEKTTRKKITRMELPTRGELILRRSQAFKEGISEAITEGKLGFFHTLVDELCQEHGCEAKDVAAAMAFLLQKDRPLDPSVRDVKPLKRAAGTGEYGGNASEPTPRPRRERPLQRSERDSKEGGDERGRERPGPVSDFPDIPLERFRLQVGHNDGVTPREIVGAIANEADIEGRYIGYIRIYDDYSTVDLPEGMPDEVFSILQKTRVCNKPLNIQRSDEKVARPASRGARTARSGAGRGTGTAARSPRSGAPVSKGISAKTAGKARPVKKNRTDKNKGKRRAPKSSAE